MVAPVDLRSDTVSRPTAAMRRAMYDAELGDDYYRDDPTVRRLEELAAEMLGKEAGLLVLSGTMGNLVSILAQTERGQSVLVEESSHVYINEGGHLAMIGGLTARTIRGERGFMSPAQIHAGIFARSVLHPPTRMLCFENTHNVAGGRCLSLAQTRAMCEAAAGHSLATHVDGARVFNAAVALGVTAAELVADVDSATFCLSKGLGCPVGSLVVGTREFVERARHYRQAVGGGMRQAGVFAAAGIVALRTMINRLADDHANARRLATILAELGLPIDPVDVETNMVFVEVPAGLGGAARFVDELRRAGVIVNPPRRGRVRFVTYHEISAADIERAGKAAATALAALRKAPASA
jgi:threonine aldolase